MKKLSIHDANQLAKSKGGKCLSDSYINNKTKLFWECSNGHKWSASLNAIKDQNEWCPICAGNAKCDINECIGFAKIKKGECLSVTYVNVNSKLQWMCDQGHTWLATFNSVKNNGTWCPHCYGRVKLEIKHAKEEAEKHNGKCLSDAYVNNCQKLLWQCRLLHTWSASLDVIRRGHWCPKCAGKSAPIIDEAISIAISRNGECLSKSIKKVLTH